MSSIDDVVIGNKKVVTLKSSDSEIFEMEETVALQSQTIKHMIEDDCANSTIPLPNVNGKTLVKVIEYCKGHVGEKEEEHLQTFDKEFIENIDQKTLFDLLLAANYLDIKSLLDLTCQTVADMIKNKSVEEVREIFNIKNDFSTEEEAAVRAENKWAFE